MKRIVYVNGEYVTEDKAQISIFDRGFLFADGVYEVTSVLKSKLIDFQGHSSRLSRSLSELQMENPLSTEKLLSVHKELIKKNNITEGLVYLQITRGAADRDFAFPKSAVPTIVMFTQEKTMLGNLSSKNGLKVISIEDQRWGRCDIKTVQLLYPCMGKMMAVAAGADDAWMVKDGKVTEGTSNNAYIIKGNKIITRQIGNEILQGITRSALIRYAETAKMIVEERPFTIEEAKLADEAFITSATLFATAVVEIDEVRIGNGKPGSCVKQLRELYIEESLKTAI
ncbi:MAG: D-amino-acid transaminase [Paracoccaceae bacterium]|tara:strand:+ start:415 stop:1266 length:852 start_codon:yes stop_codon:yes gene_type:complete